VVVLSQRPARVLKTLHVPLPDERDQGLRRSPRFLELCADLEATTSYA
jgi:ABC-type nitrate/sulfonate/bicarbonate transport system ATPase subunit